MSLQQQGASKGKNWIEPASCAKGRSPSFIAVVSPAQVLERMREAASQSTAVAYGVTVTSSVDSAAVAAGDWMFSELSDQLERAEDGLLAGACGAALK